MAIVHIRIDERLVHGQVASAWSNTLQANRIMVVNDDANSDDFQKKMLRMATPAQISLSVLSFEKTINRINEGQYDKDKVFMVIKSLTDAKELYDRGYVFDKVNIGNVSAKDNKQALTKGIYINKEDQEAIDYLKTKGVNLTVQMTPSDSIIDL